MTEPAQLPESFFTEPPAAADGSPARPLLEDLRPRYGAALAKHAQGERVTFELSLFPLPTQETDADGNHQLVAMLVLYTEIPGVEIGSGLSATRIMQPGGHNDEVIDHHARELMSGMREARSRQLAEMHRQAQQAQADGRPAPAEGLITLNGSGPSFSDIERAAKGWAAGE